MQRLLHNDDENEESLALPSATFQHLLFPISASFKSLSAEHPNLPISQSLSHQPSVPRSLLPGY
jgi:hypothetical protein